MKRYLIELPDDLVLQGSALDKLGFMMQDGEVVSYREFTEQKKKKVAEESPAPSSLEASTASEEALNEEDLYKQCSELSRRLAIIGKKKLTEQRK